MKYRIMIETTSICNANCSFCINHILQRPRMVMSDELFNLIIKRIRDEDIQVERFILHLNGEPFTDSKLIDRIHLLKREFCNVPIWFTSNFNLPDEQVINELILSDLDQITISVNATEADKYKQITGLDFAKTMSNIYYLLKMIPYYQSNLKVRFSIVDYGNGHEIEKFKKQFENLGELRIIKMGEWTSDNNHNGLKPNNSMRRSCKDLNEQICILSNGDYALCCFDSEGKTGLKVQQTPLLEAFYSIAYENMRKHLLNSGTENSICAKCSWGY